MSVPKLFLSLLCVVLALSAFGMIVPSERDIFRITPTHAVEPVKLPTVAEVESAANAKPAESSAPSNGQVFAGVLIEVEALKAKVDALDQIAVRQQNERLEAAQKAAIPSAEQQPARAPYDLDERIRKVEERADRLDKIIAELKQESVLKSATAPILKAKRVIVRYECDKTTGTCKPIYADEPQAATAPKYCYCEPGQEAACKGQCGPDCICIVRPQSAVQAPTYQSGGCSSGSCGGGFRLFGRRR